jgi:hypothetical protein
MSAPEQVWTSWRKSSYSGNTGGNCVEIAFAVEAVAVRDSKNAIGPMLSFNAAAWTAFLTR